MTHLTEHSTPADHLSDLPEAVQHELSSLARHITDMTQDERKTALEVILAVAEAFVVNTGGGEYPTLRMFDHWGGDVRTIDKAEFPRDEEVV